MSKLGRLLRAEDLCEHFSGDCAHGTPQIALPNPVDFIITDRLDFPAEHAKLQGLRCSKLAHAVTVLGAEDELELALRALVELVPPSAPAPVR